MSALQLKYFGKGRRRRAPSKRRARRRSATITVRSNPRRRRARRSARRSYRRNPVSVAGIRATLPGITSAATRALSGAAGAVVVDMAMGQAAKVLPANLTSRYNAAGGINWLYYASKAAIAIGLGVAGQRLLPGRMKTFAARGAEGSLTVQAYEILRAVIPADMINLGYYNPATVTGRGMNGLRRVGRVGKYLTPGVAGMRASFPAGSAFSAGAGNAVGEVRIGEGPTY
jgi:hypothetical protein